MVERATSLRLICPSCGDASTDPLAWRCPADSSPFELADPLHPGRGTLTGQGVWRYRDWLPAVEPVSLGEPTTPLVTLPWPTGETTFKLEAAEPTGSFKDRASAVLVAGLRAAGVPRIAEDSSGNAGASVAAYAARAGISCDIYVPATASAGKLTQIAMYGATLHPVEGIRQNAADAAARAVENGIVYATHLWNPLCIAGTATWAFELWEQLDRRLPDVVVFPIGAGTLLLGAARAFEALQRAGLVERQPRIFGIQSDACDPLARASNAGEEKPAVVTPVAGSAAEGIQLATPPRGREALRRTRESGGGIIAVEDDAVWAGLRQLAGMGIYVEPTSAAAPAGLDALRRGGRIGSTESVVVALTGSGLKASDRIRATLLA